LKIENRLVLTKNSDGKIAQVNLVDFKYNNGWAMLKLPCSVVYNYKLYTISTPDVDNDVDEFVVSEMDSNNAAKELHKYIKKSVYSVQYYGTGVDAEIYLLFAKSPKELNFDSEEFVDLDKEIFYDNSFCDVCKFHDDDVVVERYEFERGKVSFSYDGKNYCYDLIDKKFVESKNAIA